MKIKQINFNLKKFILMKKDIVLYYEKYGVIPKVYDPAGIKWLFGILDRYMFHTIEEVSEFYEEYNKPIKTNEHFQDTIYEIIDVISYLTSLLFIIEYNKYNRSSYKGNHTFDYYLDNDIFELHITDKKIDNIFMEINSNIISMRRLFPDRKWHKINNTVLDDEGIDLLFTKCENYLIEGIKLGFVAIIKYINKYKLMNRILLTEEDIKNMIYSKHEKMMNSLI